MKKSTNIVLTKQQFRCTHPKVQNNL